jgi:hypothetical protein
MKCKKCQTELPEESEFCLKCGTKVERDFSDNIETIKRRIEGASKWIDNAKVTLSRYEAFLNQNPEIKAK